MEGEISNFIMVWGSVFASIFYCYAVAKVVAKGLTRLIMFFPVVCVFVVLPFTLTSVHLGCPTVFFISWLANFKLILLAFGTGPLSEPSLPIGHFIFITCFPIKLQEKPKIEQPQIQSHNLDGIPSVVAHSTPKYSNNNGLTKLSHLAIKAFVLAILVWLGVWREHLNQNIVLFCICMYVYVGLDLMLSIVASIGQVLLQIELESPFNKPYLSTSLRDFWSGRWNRIATDNLRSAVFGPILNYSTSTIGRKWAIIQALLGTFLVSALMHEMILFYLGRTRPTFCSTLFFLLHGLCLVVEGVLKEKCTWKWALPQIMTGPLVFGFVILTFMWMVLPEVLEYKADGRALEEYEALGEFLKDLGMFWKQSFNNNNNNSTL